MHNRWQTILLAVVLALFSWYLVTGRDTVEAWVPMSVEMNSPPQGLIIREGMVNTIEVRVRGLKGLVRALTKQNLAYSLDVSQLQVGENLIDIVPESLPLSNAYQVMEIRPNRMNLVVDRMVVKAVSVEPSWSGEIDPDYKLLDIRVDPAQVEVSGPESVLADVDSVSVVVRHDFGIPPDFYDEALVLDLPDGVEASPGTVMATLAFGPETRLIWVKIPLTVDAPAGARVVPRQDFVRLHIEGPVALFRDAEFRNEMHAIIMVDEHTPDGEQELPYLVELPEGCRLERRNPETVQVTVRH